MKLDSIDHALDDLRAGRPVVVLDSADRENEGDLIMAAEFADQRWIAFFVRYSSGYLCAPMDAPHADALELPLMVTDNQDARRTAYTITVDAAEGITTGISAADRARTLRLLASPTTSPTDLIRPGHVVPLRAVGGGVRQRAGHTEAAVELCGLAGLQRVAVIGELVHDDGTMQRAPECRDFADRHGLALITIEDLIAYVERNDEQLVTSEPVVSGPHHPLLVPGPIAELPTRLGEFTVQTFTDSDDIDHIAVIKGGPAQWSAEQPPLVRVHSECLTGDSFGSLRCDCGPQLHSAMRQIDDAGSGVVIYLRGHEGRGIGLAAKIAAYSLQDNGADTVDANTSLGLPVDARDYSAAASILQSLGLATVKLLTNNPHKVQTLQRLGIDVSERVAIAPAIHADNVQYLQTKVERMGHIIPSLTEHIG